MTEGWRLLLVLAKFEAAADWLNLRTPLNMYAIKKSLLYTGPIFILMAWPSIAGCEDIDIFFKTLRIELDQYGTF